MGWIESIREAISYIEENLTDDLKVEEIAKHACLSPFYFQKGFAMLCGFTIGEYIRNRRLSLAGDEILNTKKKILDIALTYGYDSPDSFTKAFTRFHGVTPTAVRKEGATIKSYAPLKVEVSLKGGYIVDYKIVEKEAFTVMGISKKFSYENAVEEIPKFWKKFFGDGKNEFVCGMYGINMDEEMEGNAFEYMIADTYEEGKNVPDGFIKREIPKYTWAIFPCVGPSSKVMPEINQKIFKEWLPNNKDYEIAAGYNIEMYTDAAEYSNGIDDEKYYSEIWIPVKQK